jgi:hypothetical protein
MKATKREFLIWAVLALFAISGTSVVMPSCAHGDETLAEPGDPADIPPTCRTAESTAQSFELAAETLEPTPGILSSFWMILMAMAFQLAL